MNIHLTRDVNNVVPLMPASLSEERDVHDFVLSQRAAIEIRFRELYDVALENLQKGTADKFTEKLAAAFEAEVKSFLKQAPSDPARDRLSPLLQEISQRYLKRGVAEEHATRVTDRALSTEELLSQYTNLADQFPENAEAYLAEGLETLDRLAKTGVKQSTIDARAISFKAELVDAALYGASRIDPDYGEIFLNDPDFNQLIEDDAEKARYQSLIEHMKETKRDAEKYAEEQAAFQAYIAREQEHIKFIGEFRIALEDGPEDSEQDNISAEQMIAKAYYDDLIDDKEADTLQAEAAQARAANQDQEDLAKTVQEFLDSHDQPNPLSPLPQAAVDAHYTRTIQPNLKDREGAALELVEDSYIRKLGRVPTLLLKYMHGQLLSDEPAELVAVSSRLNKLASDPGLLESLATEIPAGVLLRARAIATFDGMAIAPEKLVPLADEKLAQKANEKRTEQTRAQPSQAEIRQELSQKGRFGDTEIAHLTPGELVIPRRLMTPELHQQLLASFAANGLDIGRYTVGGTDDSINPQTGLREFSDWPSADDYDYSQDSDQLNDGMSYNDGGGTGTGSGPGTTNTPTTTTTITEESPNNTEDPDNKNNGWKDWKSWDEMAYFTVPAEPAFGRALGLNRTQAEIDRDVGISNGMAGNFNLPYRSAYNATSGEFDLSGNPISYSSDDIASDWMSYDMSGAGTWNQGIGQGVGQGIGDMTTQDFNQINYPTEDSLWDLGGDPFGTGPTATASPQTEEQTSAGDFTWTTNGITSFADNPGAPTTPAPDSQVNSLADAQEIAEQFAEQFAGGFNGTTDSSLTFDDVVAEAITAASASSGWDLGGDPFGTASESRAEQADIPENMLANVQAQETAQHLSELTLQTLSARGPAIEQTNTFSAANSPTPAGDKFNAVTNALGLGKFGEEEPRGNLAADLPTEWQGVKGVWGGEPNPADLPDEWAGVTGVFGGDSQFEPGSPEFNQEVAEDDSKSALTHYNQTADQYLAASQSVANKANKTAAAYDRYRGAVEENNPYPAYTAAVKADYDRAKAELDLAVEEETRAEQDNKTAITQAAQALNDLRDQTEKNSPNNWSPPSWWPRSGPLSVPELNQLIRSSAQTLIESKTSPKTFPTPGVPVKIYNPLTKKWEENNLPLPPNEPPKSGPEKEPAGVPTAKSADQIKDAIARSPAIQTAVNMAIKHAEFQNKSSEEKALIALEIASSLVTGGGIVFALAKAVPRFAPALASILGLTLTTSSKNDGNN